MTLPMVINRSTFAAELMDTFCILSRKANFSEVQQFRALISSFRKMSSSFYVEEYHGPKHQVYFNGIGSWGRSCARCELCDVLIVSYSIDGGFSGRLTFLQAKLSKERHALGCRIWPQSAPSPLSFKANLEQWDLLARRPDILPCVPFEVPAEILRDAVVPSIGSFGVFHRPTRGKTDFFYISADALMPLGHPTRKYARLRLNCTSPMYRSFGPYVDINFCCCLWSFASELYSLRIGTPIDATDQSAKDHRHREALRSWLKGILNYHLEVSGEQGPLARELARHLGSPADAKFPSAAPALIIVRGEQDTSNPWVEPTS